MLQASLMVSSGGWSVHHRLQMETTLTRRRALGLAAGGAAALAWPGTVAARRRVVPLPTGAQVRRDIQRMVDLGGGRGRFTGTAGHDAFIDWLEEELVAAGVVMLP